MNIGFNAHLLDCSSTYRSAGVSNYIRRLLNALGEIDSTNTYRVFGNRSIDRISPMLEARRFRFVRSRLPTQNPAIRVLWEQMCLPLLITRLELLHCPVNVMPLCARIPTVVTVHDLTFMLFRDKHLAAKRSYLRAMTRLSCRRAAAIIAVSGNTRSDVLRLIGVDPSKVKVIHLAPGDEFRWLGATPDGRRTVEAFRKARNLPDSFFLYVGTLEPRKNVPLMLRAYSQFLREWNSSSAPPLLIGGARGWKVSDLPALARNLGISENVHHLGFIPGEDLPLLMNCATAFIYLSSYEGFGLPPLEAMACGVPVIVSNAASLPEVVGQAGLVVATENVEEVARTMKLVASCRETREELRKAVLLRAAEFSWQRTAKETLRVYESVAPDSEGCNGAQVRAKQEQSQ